MEAGGAMEIITGVERRRRWRLEDKLRIVADAQRPGACFADVARRHEVSRGLLWSWRDQVRRGALAPEPMPVFVPLRVTAGLSTPPTTPGANACWTARRRIRSSPSASLAKPKPEGGAGAARVERNQARRD